MIPICVLTGGSVEILAPEEKGTEVEGAAGFYSRSIGLKLGDWDILDDGAAGATGARDRVREKKVWDIWR
jgi:hypothetical protein